MLSLAACFIFFGHSMAQISQFEHSTLREFTEDRTEEPTEFNQQLSNTVSYVSFGIPVSLFVAGALRQDADMKKNALYIGESILVSSIITTGLKYAINRPRPFVNDPAIKPASPAGSPSFPSGHASEAFSAATSLVLAYPKWYVIIPAYAWAGSVAFSRMYLGVHYPSDIWAGAVVGAGSAWLTMKGREWLQQEKTKRKQHKAVGM